MAEKDKDLVVEGISKSFGAFKAVDDVSFYVEQGKFFSILGPSGCGKTTVLRLIAGFTEPDEGRILIRDKDVSGVLPNERPVNLVFQHLALFPMMSVADNVAFGLRRRKTPKATVKKKVEDVLERVGLPGFGEKNPQTLSGGQKQRVAIARCLVLEPTVLLLDEPLGALDLKLREQMKVELKTLQAQVGTTFVYITHDQSEALVMSDSVAVMNHGRFEQIDTPQNLYRRPATAFVAGFVGGSNRWEGELTEVRGDLGVLRTPCGRDITSRLTEPLTPGAKVQVYLRPEAMLIEPAQSIPNINRLRVKVQSVLFDGGNSRLLTHSSGWESDITVALPQNNLYDHIKSGDEITIGFEHSSGICFKLDPPNA